VVAVFLAESRGVSTAPPPVKGIELVPLGVYQAPGPVFDRGAAEIAAYDPLSERVFVVNAFTQTVDVLDMSNPAAPFLTHTIDVTPWGNIANSVAVHGGVVAIAVEACGVYHRHLEGPRGRTAAQTCGVHADDLGKGQLPPTLRELPNVLVTDFDLDLLLCPDVEVAHQCKLYVVTP
jgi:hypothetical protein